LNLPSIYAITDRAVSGVESHAEITRRLLDVGVRCVQVREKDMPDHALLGEVENVARLGRQAGALVFVNDRVDMARVAGTGVHLGQDDLPAADARRLLPEGARIGVSTHDVDAARGAFGDPACDYVAFGPVFTSGTKKGRSALGVEGLAAAAAGKTKPLVAVGGITADRLDAIFDAGADAAAMIGGLLSGGRIEENARRALDRGRRRRCLGRIYLVGFMGSGKTTVGRRVAERLQVPFVDLDAEIERTSGKTVRALFESVGEPAFRELESTFLEATRSLPHAVVATGGGGYVREENRRAIASLGTAVFLDVPLTVLLERLADKTDRPLFESAEQAAALAAEREPFYRMGSIPVALRLESPEEAADRVLLALDAKKRPRLFEP
jgi:thiamine-phosphate pyrophosphorylase